MNGIPRDWRFNSADFCANAIDPARVGYVTLIRCGQWSDAGCVFVQGRGLTFEAALDDACAKALQPMTEYA